ncbi:MAG: class I SAM-dependent methyltransferase [Planctomycetes bacterium]|nr:class I SAM-dependent methyltransferase [Planctomycetota bacterium]
MTTPPAPAQPDGAEIQRAIEVLSAVGPQKLQSWGWLFRPMSYYMPHNDTRFLNENRDLWTGPQETRDIDWNIDHQMSVAAEVGRHVLELSDIPKTTETVGEFAWGNPFWNNADALVQYGLVRSRKPRRIIEVGCGWSSLLLAKAVTRNDTERGGEPTVVTQIEPFPRRAVLAALPNSWKLHESILQRAPLELFDTLEAGDLLFYDGSHVAKTASDVNWFFFRVLPRLKPGVLIHIHDIFLPFDYPEQWIFERGQTWNEQYVLQAFLMNNPSYRVEIANRYLCTYKHKELEALYQGVQPTIGCSFWMLKR